MTDDARKKALLPHYAEDDVHELFNFLPDGVNYSVTSPIPVGDAASSASATEAGTQATASPSQYDEDKLRLDAYLAPRMNISFKVYQFRQAKQQANENLATFYAHLRKLAKNCEFPNEDLELKNQFILTTSSSRLRCFAMQNDVNLANLLDQGWLYEQTTRNMEITENRSAQESVNALQKPRH